MTLRTGFLSGRWLRIAARAAGLWQGLRMRRHTMALSDLKDLSYDDDGSLVSTGFNPQADLISDRPRLPRRWCWVVFTMLDQGAAANMLRLLVHQDGCSTPEPFLLDPAANGTLPILLRLPDDVGRIQLVPGNAPGRTELCGVRITEVGKLRLLMGLVLEDLQAAWRTYQTTPSFAHYKTKLIETRQARQLPTGGPHWLRIYASGVHPMTILHEGETTFTIVLNAVRSSASHLDAAIASVIAQTYPQWRLRIGCPADPACLEVVRRRMTESSAISVLDMDAEKRLSALIENDGVDYIVFINADEILEPHALARFAAAASSEEADMLYGDSILVEDDGAGYVALNALTVFSHESHLRSPGQIHPIALRGSLALLTGGLDHPAPGRETEVILRALEHQLRIVHIPDVLSRSRQPHRAGWQDGTAEIVALQAAHLRRLGYAEAEVAPTDTAGTFRVSRHARHDGRVLVVVPTKDRRALLETCITSVRATTRHDQIDIVVVDHESADADTLDYLEQVALTGVRVLRYKGSFNYSALNNAAVAELGAGYGFYLFLNNDIEAERKGWLEAMLDLAMEPDVGVVGATLLYPDRRIQHAGVIVGMLGAAEHAYRFARLEDYRDARQGPHLTRQYSAVTGACMLVNSAAFASVGGFDERLAVGFNDIDLCLRISATGRRVLQSAEAVLIHHESASRGKSHDGRDPHPDDTRLFHARHARILEEGDPFFSPLLDARNAFFVPRPLILRERDPKLRTVVHDAPARVPSEHS